MDVPGQKLCLRFGQNPLLALKTTCVGPQKEYMVKFT